MSDGVALEAALIEPLALALADGDADALSVVVGGAARERDGDHVPALPRSQNGPTLNVARCVPAIE